MPAAAHVRHLRNMNSLQQHLNQYGDPVMRQCTVARATAAGVCQAGVVGALVVHGRSGSCVFVWLLVVVHDLTVICCMTMCCMRSGVVPCI